MSSEAGPAKKRRRRLKGGRRGDSSDSSEDEAESPVPPPAPTAPGPEGSDDGEDSDESGSDAQSTRNSVSAAASRRRGPRGLQDVSDDESDAGGRGGGDDDSEGEDILDNADRDYRRIAELDRYDEDVLDNKDYGEMSLEARMEAEKALAERDRDGQARGTRLPQALQDDSDDSDDEAEEAYRRRIRSQFQSAAHPEMEAAEPEPIDLHNFNVPLREWIQRTEVVAEVKRRFADFLRNFKRENAFKYRDVIGEMCAQNAQSLLVSYLDLSSEKPTLAIWLADLPKEILVLFDQVAQKIVLEQFKNYGDIHDEVFVRITELPLKDSLRDLRTIHLNSLVRVSGVVTRRTSVLPMLKTLFFRCTCGNKLGPIEHDMEFAPAKPNCCEGTVTLDDARCVYKNYQRILLQESPGTVPAGRVPRYKDVILLSDLIDCARPGEEVEITGIYLNKQSKAMNNQQGFPVFRTIIEANYVQKQQDLFTTLQITDDDRKNFRKMAKHPQIAQRVIGSIAPSIYGCEHVKTALAMAMFGGQEKNVNNKHRIRGDINVLLMGDPGTAKSQCLKYTEKTAPRAVYTTGKGASAVGLTAAVQKDPITREWVLEGGALVLADRGVCLIDEFDKMNDQDRTSIHEAMEQQSISISKAGIVTTLQARCSVIAAANPIGGRYDPQRSFAENVELTDPIIQRFDVLCVLQDTIDPIADERLAKFVVSSHVRSHPDGCISKDEAENSENANNKNVNIFSDWTADNNPPGGLIDHEVLKKYILYARSLKPVLHQVDTDKVSSLYGDLRRESLNSGGVPIAVRHMESIIRMAEAYARIHLRENVNHDDIDMAIRVALESFIQAQKHSVMRSLRRSFQKYIIYKKDTNDLLLYLLQELVKDSRHYSRVHGNNPALHDKIQVSGHDFERKAREIGIRDVSHFLNSENFRQRGFHRVMNEGKQGGNRSGYTIIKQF